MKRRGAERLVGSLASVRAAILSTTRALSPAFREATTIGTWSAEDLVRHLIGWDQTNLRAIRAIRRGTAPSFYSAYDPDWASYNARLVRRYRRSAGAELLREARQSHHRLLEELGRLATAEWSLDRGVRFRGRRVTIESLMRVELADERQHLRDLRRISRLARW